MSDFEKWYGIHAIKTDRKEHCRAAYQAGQESVIEAATATAEAYDGAQTRVGELEKALGNFMAAHADFIRLTGGRDMVRHPLRKQIEESRVVETYLAARLVIEKQAQEAPVDA